MQKAFVQKKLKLVQTIVYMSICLITLIFFYATSLISYKAKLHSSTYKLHWLGLVIIFIHLFTLEFNKLIINSTQALAC